jgi:hypothetical protein
VVGSSLDGDRGIPGTALELVAVEAVAVEAMADQNHNRPYRANEPNRRPSTQAPSNSSGNDPLAELARLIGQNDPFAEYNPSGSRPRADMRAPAANPADWKQTSDPAHDDFFRRPAAHSSYSDDQDADGDAPSASSDRYLSGHGYYDQNAGHPERDRHRDDDRDHRQGADSYSDYHQPDQPEYEQPRHGQPGYEQSGYEQPAYDRGGSNAAGYPRGGHYDSPGVPPNSPSSERQGYPRPDAYASRSRNDAHPQGYPQNDGYSEHDSYEDDGHSSDDRYDDPPPAPRRSGLITVIAVLGLAVVGTAGAFTYRATFGKGGSSSPLVIKRDPAPTKMAVAQSDAQSSKPALERVERIVPREEHPLDVQQTIVADQPPASLPGYVPGVRPAIPNAPPPSLSAAPPAATGSVPAAPKRIHTVPIPVKPSDVDAGPASPPAATGRVAQSKPLVPASNAPLSLLAQTRTAVAANPPATHVASSGSPGTEGGYLVQVSSQRSESDAQASFRALKAKYPDVMGDREPVIRRADLGEKGIYYRAMVGSFATAQEAGQFCDSLKAAGGACLIQKN